MSENPNATGAGTVHESSEALRAEGLGKTYAEGRMKTHVFDGLDLHVNAGETVAIVGASGVGKSTLLHVLGALDTPTSGRISIDGVDLGALDDTAASEFRRNRVGFIFQFFNLVPTMSASSRTTASAARASASRARTAST